MRSISHRPKKLFFQSFVFFLLFIASLFLCHFPLRIEIRYVESQAGIFKLFAAQIPSFSIEAPTFVNTISLFDWVGFDLLFASKSKRIKMIRDVRWPLESCMGNFRLGTILGICRTISIWSQLGLIWDSSYCTSSCLTPRRSSLIRQIQTKYFYKYLSINISLYIVGNTRNFDTWKRISYL